MKKGLMLIFGMVLVLGILSGVSALDLQVSGLDDGIYDSRRLAVGLTSDEYVDFFFLENFSDVSGNWRRLCRDALGCERIIRFSEGENNVAFKVINGGGESQVENLSFFIDSRDPRASRTFPRRNSFVNDGQNFSVIYTEENVNEVRLNYWFDGSSRVVSKTDCPSGRGEECAFNFPNSPGGIAGDGEMIYWFEVVDVAGNIGETMETRVYVDNTSPVLVAFEKIEGRRRIDLMIELVEENFDEIFYIDKGESDSREHRLCSTLRHGRCTARKSFRTSGNYVWDIIARDLAGNEKVIESNLKISV